MNIPDESELAHLQVWELLPWVVNGRISERERKLVDDHMRGCERCQAELAAQRKLCAAMSSREVADAGVERSLERLWQRFDKEAQPAVIRTGTSSSAAPWRGQMAAIACGLAAIVLLETGALATLGFSRGADRAPASYRTLAQAEGEVARATIRLVADPAMPIGQLQGLLVPLHLQIVGGPSENGVYSLAPVVLPADVVKQLAALRAVPGIRFAEPVGEAAAAP